MSYFDQWQEILQDGQTESARATIGRYYELETAAYEWILNYTGEILAGSAGELAEKLGFGQDMVIFLGFLDGIHDSLQNQLDPAVVDETTPIELVIDFRKLYWNMHEAKADWLYGLKAWDNVLEPAEQREITRQYRETKIVRVEKVGRNDPCPCGSGKKYKNCCGRG
jgi:hypothetical protein